MAQRNETVRMLQLELRQLRREMRARGVRRLSCFNSGLSKEEYRMNAEFFRITTELKTAKERCNA